MTEDGLRSHGGERRCFGGRHVNRDTPRALRDGGFALEILERWYGGLWVRGTARPE